MCGGARAGRRGGPEGLSLSLSLSLSLGPEGLEVVAGGHGPLRVGRHRHEGRRALGRLRVEPGPAVPVHEGLGRAEVDEVQLLPRRPLRPHHQVVRLPPPPSPPPPPASRPVATRQHVL